MTPFLAGDAIKELAIIRRIALGQAAPEHGDGPTVHTQGRAMGRGVHAAGPAGDHRQPALGERLREAFRLLDRIVRAGS